MRDNQGLQNGMTDQPVLEGTPVYDVNGDKVGEVSERGMQGNALVVKKGVFFPKDLYIPLSAIRGRDADGLYLSVAKDEINTRNWDTPPTEGLTTANTVNTAATAATANTVATSGASDVAIPIREEELVAEKQRQQMGDVRVHREVTQERQTIQTPVTHEEVYVERRPGNDQQLGADAFTEKDIDVPVMGEQLTAGKEAHVAEEVHLRKERVTNQQQVSGTVRREHVDIEGRPDEAIHTRDQLTDQTDMTDAPNQQP